MKWFVSLLLIAFLVVTGACQCVANEVALSDQLSICIDNDVGIDVPTINNELSESPAFLVMETQYSTEGQHFRQHQSDVKSMQTPADAIYNEGPMCRTKMPEVGTISQLKLQIAEYTEPLINYSFEYS